MSEVRCDAILSRCKTWRLTLLRVWDDSLPRLGWIMLNPSTADANADDPTIRRCVQFAKAWGFGGIEVRNLFAFRAASPATLVRAHRRNPRGANRYLLDLFQACPQVVAAWGAKGTLANRDRRVLSLLKSAGLYDRLVCLGITRQGHPRHPLYLAANTRPGIFRGQ